MLTYRLGRAAGLLAVVLVASGLTGCKSLGARMERGALPPGAPTEQQVLSDLAANDGKIQSISESNATMSLKSPRLKATQVVSADIKFERPDRLRIVGRQRAFRTEVFRITSVGSEFVVDIPSEGPPTYRHAGETIEGVPFTVSPSDIARELFLPEDWSQLTKDDVRVTGYDPAAGQATLEVGPKGHPWRRVAVAGPPWHVVLSERLDEQGQVVARTTLSDYREYDGLRFPATLDAVFPTEETELILSKFDNPKFNLPLEESNFAIDWRQYETRAH
jgi:hypothetical protein